MPAPVRGLPVQRTDKQPGQRVIGPSDSHVIDASGRWMVNPANDPRDHRMPVEPVVMSPWAIITSNPAGMMAGLAVLLLIVLVAVAIMVLGG